MLRKLTGLWGVLFAVLITTTACQPVQPVSVAKAEAAVTAEQANQAVVERFYEEVVNQKHPEVMQEVFDAKMVDHELGYGDYAKDVDLFAAFPDLHINADQWVIEGDMLAAVVTVTGTHTGAELMGVPATGNQVTFSQIDVWHVKDGKILEVWHNFATADILQQIGYTLVPPAQ